MKKVNWKIEEQSHFLKRIGELLSRGYPLSEAIESVILHLPIEKKLQVNSILFDLKEGYPFYQALTTMEFNNYLIGYVFFAEQHGGLEKAFQEGSEMMLKRGSDVKKLKKLLVYPCFLIGLTAILFLFVEGVLLPRFSSLFTSMNLQENLFTKLIRMAGEYLPYLLITFMVISIFIGVFYLFHFKKLPHIKQASTLAAVPIAGPFFRLFYTHYFTIQLHYLLTGGLSVLSAFSLFEKNEKQPLYKEIGEEMKINLRNGEKFEEMLTRYHFFDRELFRVIKHGQNNGKLDQELYYFSKHCLRQLEERTDKALKIVQPVMYGLIGFLIVSMYLAVLLPMFHLLEGI
ncbi:competence type IV pilus assembly protein ComGB [Cytobacillus purgationiresistens]|uniref:Competence protein ComGB n=1 Tax=Cytobacillus purgationiresistens TaxID=863449 RepID=A0ABU0ADW1_9BACI|nr:competence type IV pilus assembly protein ComGB [Cytobacillus purgationiresistens]MDQ0269427.1 competence protein ComGB [Cytobacillus purgationiresistens]